MKKLLTAALAAVFVLSGCTINTGGTEPQPTISRPSETASEAVEQAFYEQIDRNYPGLPRETVIAAGYTSCTVIDERGIEGLFDWARAEGIQDLEFFGYLSGAAVRHLCPEHVDEVREHLDEQQPTML